MGSLYLLIYFKIEIKNLLHVNVNRFLIKNCIFPLHSVPSCRNPRLYPTPRTCRQEIFENLDVLTMSRDELEPGGSRAPGQSRAFWTPARPLLQPDTVAVLLLSTLRATPISSRGRAEL